MTDAGKKLLVLVACIFCMVVSLVLGIFSIRDYKTAAPHEDNSNWLYVHSHDCWPISHHDGEVEVVNGVEKMTGAFSTYKCAGVDVNVYVDDKERR